MLSFGVGLSSLRYYGGYYPASYGYGGYYGGYGVRRAGYYGGYYRPRVAHYGGYGVRRAGYYGGYYRPRVAHYGGYGVRLALAIMAVATALALVKWAAGAKPRHPPKAVQMKALAREAFDVCPREEWADPFV